MHLPPLQRAQAVPVYKQRLQRPDPLQGMLTAFSPEENRFSKPFCWIVNGAGLLSMDPWNTGTPQREDMPQKLIDIKLTDYPIFGKEAFAPFSRFLRGWGWAEPR